MSNFFRVDSPAGSELQNSFKQIISKLDTIIEKMNGGSSTNSKAIPFAHKTFNADLTLIFDSETEPRTVKNQIFEQIKTDHEATVATVNGFDSTTFYYATTVYKFNTSNTHNSGFAYVGYIPIRTFTQQEGNATAELILTLQEGHWFTFAELTSSLTYDIKGIIRLDKIY